MMRVLKDIVRHTLRRMGFVRRFSYLSGNRQDKFSAIYDQKIWTHGQKDMPLSGFGSSLQATKTLRSALPDLIARLKVTSLLDLGCGDFTWMQHVDLKCDYIGLDIVPSVIEVNQRNFASPTRSFEVFDFVESVPPKVDLIFCREVLFHLSFDDIKKGLKNALSSGCTYLLLTSDSNVFFNSDIESGDFRSLNLERRPFLLPPPLERIEDSEISNGRQINLWTAKQIRDALA